MAITATDTNYDGLDVVVTNCTVAVDGPRTFANLLVTTDRTVTHTFHPSGSFSDLLSVANEPQTLVDTNPVALLNSNILTETICLTD